MSINPHPEGYLVEQLRTDGTPQYLTDVSVVESVRRPYWSCAPSDGIRYETREEAAEAIDWLRPLTSWMRIVPYAETQEPRPHTVLLSPRDRRVLMDALGALMGATSLDPEEREAIYALHRRLLAAGVTG